MNKPETIRVRIPVAVGRPRKGRKTVPWHSASFGYLSQNRDDRSRACYQSRGNLFVRGDEPSHIVWIEADVPLPPPPPTVEGSVINR